jgi:DNA-binding transcriptional MerR regulator
MTEKTYNLDDLCKLSNISKRTIRYYIQLGLLERPHGETRAAHYTGKHIEQLLQLKKWSDAGISLERIRELFAGDEVPVPPRRQKPGTVEVRSHILVKAGIEIQITPEEAGMSPEQLRHFVREVMAAAERTLESKPQTTS